MRINNDIELFIVYFIKKKEEILFKSKVIHYVINLKSMEKVTIELIPWHYKYLMF